MRSPFSCSMLYHAGYDERVDQIPTQMHHNIPSPLLTKRCRRTEIARKLSPMVVAAGPKATLEILAPHSVRESFRKSAQIENIQRTEIHSIAPGAKQRFFFPLISIASIVSIKTRLDGLVAISRESTFPSTSFKPVLAPISNGGNELRSGVPVSICQVDKRHDLHAYLLWHQEERLGKGRSPRILVV